MNYGNATMTDMDWANVKAFVAKQQQETAGRLGMAAGWVGSLCLWVSNANNWVWWALAMWGAIWWMLRDFDKKAVAAARARDELDAYYFKDTE